jgi:predicted SAM-dependent methyltransferase
MEINQTLYKIQDRLNNFILWTKKNKRYKLKEGEIGLNLGCEIETIGPFVGIDGSFLIFLIKSRFVPKIIKKKLYRKTWTSERISFEEFVKKMKHLRIIHHNLNYGIPFRKNSLDYIYSSHFLEHIGKKEGEKLIKESFRVLKNGGAIRLVTPNLDEDIRDLEKEIKLYKKSRLGERIQKYFIVPALNSSFAFHRKVYNFEDLERLLGKNGFSEIKKMKRNKGNFPELKKLETRGGLVVEARK